MSDPILLERRGTFTAEIRLNRPERANALNDEIVTRLTHALAQCYINGSKLVILSGEGKHFCSGFDRRSGDKADAASRAALGTRIETLLQLLWNAPFISVSCVQGSAVGAGADIAVSCDYRLALPDAMYFFPGFRLLGVSLGNRRLARIIGPGRAIDAILRARRFPQKEAAACGMAFAFNHPDDAWRYISDLEQQLYSIKNASISSLRKRIRGETRDEGIGNAMNEMQTKMH